MTSLASASSAPDASWPAFYGDLHRKYIRELGAKTDSYEYQVTEHLRLSGVYWGFTAMSLLRAQHEMGPDSVVEWVLEGYRTVALGGDSGGDGGDDGGGGGVATSGTTCTSSTPRRPCSCLPSAARSTGSLSRKFRP